MKLGFLKEAEANRLRNDLLARAAGLRVARERPAAATAPGALSDPGPRLSRHRRHAGREVTVPATDAPSFVAEAPEQPVTAVGPGRLVASLLRSGATVGLVLGVLGIAGVVVGTREIGILFSALPAVLGFGGFLFSRFTGSSASGPPSRPTASACATACWRPARRRSRPVASRPCGCGRDRSGAGRTGGASTSTSPGTA